MIQKIIRYKNKSYILIKKATESSEQFYHRAWLVAKTQPKTCSEFKESLLNCEKKINEIYLGYSY
jgi:hypothetical protein